MYVNDLITVRIIRRPMLVGRVQVSIVNINHKPLVIRSVISFPINIPLGCNAEQNKTNQCNHTCGKKVAK